MRRARAGDLTGEGVRAFLAHLAASANVTLSTQAVGVSKVAIYNRARRSPAFAREVQASLKEGFERVEPALAEAAIQSLTPDGEDLTDWHDASLAHEPLAKMDVWQALAVLQNHRRTVALGRRRPSAQRRPWTLEQTDALLTKALDREERRAKRDAERRGKP